MPEAIIRRIQRIPQVLSLILKQKSIKESMLLFSSCEIHATQAVANFSKSLDHHHLSSFYSYQTATVLKDGPVLLYAYCCWKLKQTERFVSHEFMVLNFNQQL